MSNVRFDLSELVDRLGADRRYQAVIKAIYLLKTWYQTRADLQNSKEALDASLQLAAVTQGEEGSISSDTMATMNALQSSAILFYCRAVHSKPASPKYRVDITEGMDSEQRKKYREVTSLRDKVIAHHGYGTNEVGGDWLRDRVTIQFFPDKARLTYHYIAKGSQAPVMNALNELVREGLSLVAKKQASQERTVASLLVELLNSDVHFKGIFERCVFDEKAFAPDGRFDGVTKPGDRLHVTWPVGKGSDNDPPAT
jgi:hypothetical protein